MWAAAAVLARVLGRRRPDQASDRHRVGGSGAPATTGPTASTLPRDPAHCALLTPWQLGGCTLRNRVVRAAAFGGASLEATRQTHVAVARGGVAMTTIAYASVSADGMTFASQLLLSDPGTLRGLAELAEQVHAAGAAISIQLTHAGGFASSAVIGGQQKAPSATFSPANLWWSKEMSAADLDRVAGDFAAAARGVKAAGFDAIELHCGHGYLLSQFLSPATNRRTDEYGGSQRARFRFPLRVLAECRAAVGAAFPVAVKFNLSDGFDSGLELSDAVAFSVALEKAGADLLVPSCGYVDRNGFFMLRGRVPMWSMVKAIPGITKKLSLGLFGWAFVPTVPFGQNFLRDDAVAVLDAVDRVPVALIGGVSSLSGAEQAVRRGFACVQMARALIREPDFVNRIEASLASGAVAGVHDVASPCTHCNECVVATLDPSLSMSCPDRDMEDLTLDARHHAATGRLANC